MFTVGFNLADNEVALQPADVVLKAPDPDLRGVHALIADDERLSCMVLSRLLKRWGAQVEEVWNGTKAKERCTEAIHELVILDENMPGCTGTQVAQAIREHETGGTPAFIILSSGDSEAGAALVGGLVDATLPKPLVPESLRNVLAARFPVQLGQ
jgi:CheY-like chemotaxis protein